MGKDQEAARTQVGEFPGEKERRRRRREEQEDVEMRCNCHWTAHAWITAVGIAPAMTLDVTTRSEYNSIAGEL